jgi:hypothetical protein
MFEPMPDTFRLQTDVPLKLLQAATRAIIRAAAIMDMTPWTVPSRSFASRGRASGGGRSCLYLTSHAPPQDEYGSSWSLWKELKTEGIEYESMVGPTSLYEMPLNSFLVFGDVDWLFRGSGEGLRLLNHVVACRPKLVIVTLQENRTSQDLIMFAEHLNGTHLSPEKNIVRIKDFEMKVIFPLQRLSRRPAPQRHQILAIRNFEIHVRMRAERGVIPHEYEARQLPLLTAQLRTKFREAGWNIKDQDFLLTAPTAGGYHRWHGFGFSNEFLARAFYYTHRDTLLTSTSGQIIHLELHNEDYDEELRTEDRALQTGVLRDRMRTAPLTPQMFRTFSPPISEQLFFENLPLTNQPVAPGAIEP